MKQCAVKRGKKGCYYTPNLLVYLPVLVSNLQTTMFAPGFSGLLKYRDMIFYKQCRGRLLRLHLPLTYMYEWRGKVYNRDGSSITPVTATLLNKVEWLFL